MYFGSFVSNITGFLCAQLFRIDVHSKDITQLINQALGDLDNPPRAYLLLAEGKLRALRAHKLPAQSRGRLRFQVCDLIHMFMLLPLSSLTLSF